VLPRVLIMATALVAPGAAALLYRVEPTDNGWFPRCVLYQITGIHCPFCGGTRCAHALLNGDLGQALAWNPLAVLVLPAAALWLYWAAWRVCRKRPVPSANPPKWVVWSVTGAVVVFWLLRNLPVAPFQVLAPHQLN
jgi:hypothetical protein